ncbi:MAG: S41 family peptidase [Bdellovibrionota bacterium]|jgi:carboxyl-terminal processing protease
MPSHFLKFSRILFYSVLLSLLAVSICTYKGADAFANDGNEGPLSEELLKELKVFTDVLTIVQRDYVEDVKSKKLVEGAIRGMLAALDPHSGYLDPDFYQDLQVQTKGHFGGLGIEITMNNDGVLVVMSPMSGSPAEKAGIMAGDAIIKIGDKYTKEFSLVEAVKKLRGPKGTEVKLSLARKGRKKLINVVVVREEIKVQSIKSRFLGEGYGYVRITQFMDNTAHDLKKALNAMRKQNGSKELKGLILDVRNNPGGLLNQAVAVSDMFLKKGIIVYTDGRVSGQKKKFFAHERGTEADYPLVVLINGGSASASEILAGAIQDDGRGLILGTRTFGKGSVQTITPLENGGALTLTTALYYTKSGRSIQATGVAPDIEFDIERTKRKARGELQEEEEEDVPVFLRESELDGAIKNPDGVDDAGVLRKINKTPQPNKGVIKIDPEKGDLKAWLAQDSQVAKALEVLKTFDVFKDKIGKREQSVANDGA